MIDIVNELIAIENNANEILMTAENDKLGAHEIIDLISNQMNQKISELAQLEIADEKKITIQMKNERINQICTKSDDFILQMKNEFAENKNDWALDIFNKILEDT